MLLNYGRTVRGARKLTASGLNYISRNIGSKAAGRMVDSLCKPSWSHSSFPHEQDSWWESKEGTLQAGRGPWPLGFLRRGAGPEGGDVLSLYLAWAEEAGETHEWDNLFHLVGMGSSLGALGQWLPGGAGAGGQCFQALVHRCQQQLWGSDSSAQSILTRREEIGEKNVYQ